MSRLFMDIEPIRQPKGTHRFAQNFIIDNDRNFVTEPSVELCFEKKGFQMVGSISIGDNENILFFVSEETSVIGLLKKDCIYTDIVEFDKLKFNINYPIKGVYRLRNGCEKVIYWVDGLNPPRYFNIDKPELFQTNGNWDIDKFNLLATYNRIPKIQLEVEEGNGQLRPGSYNVAIQYIDSNFNATTFANITDTIVIYNSSLYNEFKDIRGSNKRDPLGNTYPNTSKSIKITTTNLDDSYQYYRIAIIEATEGTGYPTSVKYTDLIPITQSIYIYTGENYKYEGSYDELLASRLEVVAAETIEQIENRLVLANIKVTNYNYCELQQYASQIVSDCVVYKVDISDIKNFGNPKNPILHLGKIGYQPGEIYSFGIVYIFGDGSLSPAFHIPGKSKVVSDSHTFTTGNSEYPVYGMLTDNECQNIKYYDLNDCNNLDYWGNDYHGDPLVNTNVRHHRFPYRKDINVPLVEYDTISYQRNTRRYCLSRLIELTTIGDPNLGYLDNLKVIIYLNVDGVIKEFSAIFYPTPNNNAPGWTINVDFCTDDIPYVTNITLHEIVEDYVYYNPPPVDVWNHNPVSATSLYNIVVHAGTTTITEDKRYINIYGIKFSNIIQPPTSIAGKEVVGYFIVRNERDDVNETIVDSAVVSRGIYNKENVGMGLLMPENQSDYDLTCSDYDLYIDNIFQFFSPRLLSDNINIGNNYNIIHQGYFYRDNRQWIRGKVKKEDILQGSSYSSEFHQQKYADSDGWDLKIITRDSKVRYVLEDGGACQSDFNIDNSDIRNIVKLRPLQTYNGLFNGNNINVINYSLDNNIGILEAKRDIVHYSDRCLPYVYLNRPLSDPYGNFIDLPYLKCHDNLVPIQFSEIIVFGGDVYISPLRMCSMILYGNRVAKRCAKSGGWLILTGILSSTAGVLAGIVSATTGSPIPGGGTLVSLGTNLIIQGINQITYNKNYYSGYDINRARDITDCWVKDEYEYTLWQDPNTRPHTPCDDEIEWIADFITDLWFETKIPFQLRYGKITDNLGLLASPGIHETATQTEDKEHRCSNKVICTEEAERNPQRFIDQYALDKIIDKSRPKYEQYVGLPHAELYLINKDYMRRNKEQVFFAIPYTYDCCSSCVEKFPHRLVYSQQSFLEEQGDNYRVFLPNNYRDIEGISGEITNIFRIQNKLYINTEYSIWLLPPSLQERVNKDIVTFIGTGEFFSIPPRRLIESNILGAGLSKHTHLIKTRDGVFWVSLNDRKIYHLTAKGVIPISDGGIKKVCNDILDFEVNPLSLSYISIGYDSYFRRVLFTVNSKKYDDSLDEDRYCYGDKYFTVSYNIVFNAFISFHTYFPKFYVNDSYFLYSWDSCNMKMYKHLYDNSYRKFYEGNVHDSIIEFVYVNYPMPKVTNDVLFDTMVFKVPNSEFEYILEDKITFDKAVLYNEKQCTNLLTLRVRKPEDIDYMLQRVINNTDTILERRERFWSINDIRNNRTLFDDRMWLYAFNGSSVYDWKDKELNFTQFAPFPLWTEKGYMIGKYLVIRLIFSNSDDRLKLIYRMNFVEDTFSQR